MSDDVQRTDRVLVIPGESVGDSSHKSGNGTYRRGDGIFAAQLGVLNFRAGFVNVIPFAGKYMPKQGDPVIGIVLDAGPNSWMVDINCPYTAFLHANETPWKVEFGTATQHLAVGDTVLAKVSQVDETRRVNISLKEQGLRKLNNGQVMRLNYSKVRRVLGKGGSMISLLKEKTGCRIFIGQNGVLWIDGELDGMVRASAAIGIIDRDPNMQGLTDAVREFLEGNRAPVGQVSDCDVEGGDDDGSRD